MRIVFMGTPDFAVPCLTALVDAGHEVAAVVCQPDRPRGRGRKVALSPVKEKALDLDFPVLQPERPRGDDFAAMLSQYRADAFVVVAYGHILPKRILEMPEFGAVNVHASLLPKYRGPAPIHWAVADCEPYTGVCTMRMDKGMDTGDLLLCERIPVGSRDTAGTMHDKLADLGAGVLVRTMDGLAAGRITPVPQDHSLATYARPLVKEDGRLDWTRPAWELDCHARGMTPWPGAFAYHGDKRLKIWRARAVEGQADAAPGTVLCASGDAFHVACGEGILSLLEVQGASGKRLSAGDFLRGVNVAPGDILG
ncbi:MAG: methionyl-tRNA formyltransferase [Desulfatibacillaceae bacterium]